MLTSDVRIPFQRYVAAPIRFRKFSIESAKTNGNPRILFNFYNISLKTKEEGGWGRPFDGDLALLSKFL